jgi:hypothetical protein
MTGINAWVFTLGGAGLLCGIAKALIPSKTAERQMELLLSLVLLSLVLRCFGSVSFEESAAFSRIAPEDLAESENSVAEKGVLFLTRLELAALVEQTLKEETGVGFRVVSVGLSGSRDNVTVSKLSFSSLNGKSPDEIADILHRRLGLNSAVQEVREP